MGSESYKERDRKLLEDIKNGKIKIKSTINNDLNQELQEYRCVLCNNVIPDTTFSKSLCNDCLKDADCKCGLERLGLKPDEDHYISGVNDYY